MKTILIIVGCLLLTGCPTPPPVKTPPPPPLQVQLSWQGPATTPQTGYRIYRGTFNGKDCGLPVIYVDGVKVTVFNDTGVKDATTYCYAVSLYDSLNKNESIFSNAVSITTP